MKFKFDVKTNEQDYIDYNIFWMIRSPYGKKQIRNMRCVIAVCFVIIILMSFYNGGFTLSTALGLIPQIILFALAQILLIKVFTWAFKSSIKSMKKTGKMGYSPESVIEFYEESFIETTPENKSEQKYFAIERISIVDNKMIYIHVNNILAYIIPLSCFESKQQYDDFIEFIKTKCSNIDIY